MTNNTNIYQESPNDTWEHNGTHYKINDIFKVAHTKKIDELAINLLEDEVRNSQVTVAGKQICGSCFHQTPSFAKAVTRHQKRVANSDITIPIIILNDDNRFSVIDGVHRLEKAMKEELKMICVKILTPQEIIITKLEI